MQIFTLGCMAISSQSVSLYQYPGFASIASVYSRVGQHCESGTLQRCFD